MTLNLDYYRNALRAFLKDHQDLNRLLKFEEENADDNLDLYINLAISFLNSIPPMSKVFTITDFPFPALLIHQSSIEALISNSIVYARNDITFNNGGVTVKVTDKERYLPILQNLYRITDSMINMFRQTKVSINIDQGWGYSSSPYSSLTGNYSLQPNSLF